VAHNKIAHLAKMQKCKYEHPLPLHHQKPKNQAKAKWKMGSTKKTGDIWTESGDQFCPFVLGSYASSFGCL